MATTPAAPHGTPPEPHRFSPWLTILVAVLGLAAVLVLLLPGQAFSLAGITGHDLAQPVTARESLREALLIIAATVAVGAAVLLALFASFGLLREPLVLLAAILVALLVHSVSLARIGYVPDEAFIHFAYARNLAQHGQLAFNLGEADAGYSSLPLVLLLTPFAFFAQILPVVANGLALIASVPTVSVLYILGRRLNPGRSPAWSLLAPFLLALYPGYVFCTATVIETQLVTLLVTVGACLYILHPTGRRGWWWPLVLALAAVARSDALLVLAATVAYHALATRREQGALRALAVHCIPAAALILAYWLWQVLYHGHYPSSSFFARGAAGLSAARLSQGAYYVGSFITQLVGVTIFLVPIAAAVVGLRRALTYCAVVPAAFLLYVAFAGGDPLPAHRLAAVVAPLLFFLLQESAAALHAAVARPDRRSTTALNLTLAFALLLAFPFPYFRREAELVRRVADLAEASRSLRDIGSYVGRDPDAVVAVHNAGRVKWESDHTVIDLSGRCNYTIATQGADAAPYVLGRQPRYIVLTAVAASAPEGDAAKPPDLLWPIERRLAVSDSFRQHYAFVRSFRCHEHAAQAKGRYLWLYRRRADAASQQHPGN